MIKLSVEVAKAADAQRIQACLGADTAQLERLMAPGGLYIHTAGNIDTRDEFIEKVRSGTLKYQSIDNKVVAADASQGSVVIAGVLNMHVIRSGVPAQIHIRYGCVWVVAEAGPQMVLWQATPLASSI